MTKKQAIKIVCYIVSVIALVFICGRLLNMNRKEDNVRIYSFYKEPENSIDVFMVGCSEVMRGYIPTLAYEEQGFTSFPAATAGMPMSLYKYMIMECERLHNPKLYIVEVNGVYYEDQHEEAKLRQWLDNVPLNETKKEAIDSLVPKEKRRAFLFPFEKYHSNWKNVDDIIKVQMYKRTIDKQGYSVCKNFNADLNCGPVKISGKPEKHKMTEQGEEYLRELLEYLKAEGIDNVLFVRWPHWNRFEVDGTYDDVINLVGKYGYEFVNFSEYMTEMGIEPAMDFSDNEHLNPFGAEKMTKFLAKYIVDNYDVRSEYSKKIIKEWDTSAKKMDEILKACQKRTIRKTKERIYTDYDYYKILKEEA